MDSLVGAKKQLLIDLKNDLCISITKKYSESILKNIQPELISTLTMKEFVEQHQGNIDIYLQSLKPKRGRPKKNTKTKPPRSSTVSTRSRESKILDGVNWRSSIASDASSHRRITLQGGSGQFELTCLLPQEGDGDISTDATDMSSLSTEELLKLRQVLEESKARTDQLLASLGI